MEERRALVVGGTGMLAGVVEALATRGWSVTVVARGHHRLDAVARLSEVAACRADYRDLASFESAVRAALPVRLVVAWIHSTAPEAPAQLARLVADADRPVPFYHVLGSAAGRAPASSSATELAGSPGIDYRQVVLGYVREQNTSRWLTHAEIVAGLLEAIDAEAPRSVVGRLEPWSERPGGA